VLKEVGKRGNWKLARRGEGNYTGGKEERKSVCRAASKVLKRGANPLLGLRQKEPAFATLQLLNGARGEGSVNKKRGLRHSGDAEGKRCRGEKRPLALSY